MYPDNLFGGLLGSQQTQQQHSALGTLLGYRSAQYEQSLSVAKDKADRKKKRKLLLLEDLK